MSTLFTSHVYRTDAILPDIGEVIKIHCSVSSFDFNFGPCSDSSLGTRSTTVSQPNTTVRHGKPPFHHVIVSAVSVSADRQTIEIQFFPIASYSKPPPGVLKANWNPPAWMEAQPEATILQHLSVPAVGWSPAPHHLWGPDPLDFGGWLNVKPSWVIILPCNLSIPTTDTWKRFSPPVFLSRVHLTAVRGFRWLRQEYLSSLQNVVAVNRAVLPDYGPVWAGMGGPLGYSDNDSESESDDDSGSDVSYGVDPITMWRYDGAPKEMREMVQRHDEATKKVFDEKMLMWVVNVEEPCEEEDAGCKRGEEEESD